ncbi:EamA family transporter RarD [Novosphingobium sp. TH158]|uniref:EamA family transporter RarD n=1 Tax=Novosphingobium sp. TH158 TaxID=2067455 RepID=UPI000C79E2E8|nr:EamA family transporter RarD [Novosphingobium sp. TH158]PLK26565.1 EamA family transporter RarD [Novosphingobium sp. TH158]
MTGAQHRQGGLPLALGAYLIWGLLPLYLRLVHHVPPFEFVGWRVVFTLPFCMIAVTLARQWPAIRQALGNRRTVLTLLASSLLIGGNWLIYIAAIQSGHVFATSLGYYINPLINVLLGTVFLGERLNRRQWLAVALAGAGVALLAFGAVEMLWISLSLALSFGGYGLVRKVAPVESLPGLTIESAVLLLPALAIIGYYGQGPQGTAIGEGMVPDLLVALSGVLTAVPLLLFAAAARRMDYSTLGFVQFLSPSIVFLLGLFVFHEPLRTVQLGSFLLIWAAIGLFVADLLARRRTSRQIAS